MKKTDYTYTVPPAGKRKHEIVFRATFKGAWDWDNELKDNLAMALWKMGVFD